MVTIREMILSAVFDRSAEVCELIMTQFVVQKSNKFINFKSGNIAALTAKFTNKISYRS